MDYALSRGNVKEETFMASAAVVLIVYSPTPSPAEAASFAQALRVLGGHPLRLVCPESLPLGVYQTLCDEAGVHVLVERFADAFFTSVDSYNSLMLSLEFYDRFLEFEYILLYQLDAWVFTDELAAWCARGYNYVGAPWFNDAGVMLPYAGNGGFCLRSPKACRNLLSGPVIERWNYSFFFQQCPTLYESYRHFRDMAHFRRVPRHYVQHYIYYEDMLFARFLQLTTHGGTAPPQQAMYFSFECFPEKLYAQTGQLPFGCHAFARYNPQFWKPWIPCL